MVNVQQLIDSLGLSLALPDNVATRVPQNLSDDSRSIQAGDAFIACKGMTFDGRDFIAKAIEQGASVIFAEADTLALVWQDETPVLHIPQLTELQSKLAASFYGDPSKKVTVIGVTGTNGKTSMTHFIAQALQHCEIRCAVIGTLGNGFLDALVPSTMTTPDPVKLQYEFAKLVEQGAEVIAMEVSSHALDQHRVAAIDFDIAVFTQLSRDHLDYHGTMEAYADAKSKLFLMPSVKTCVLNADDALGEKLIHRVQDKAIVPYSLRPECELDAVKATQITYKANGFQVAVSTPWGDGVFQANLLGRFNISNLLAVLSVLRVMQIDLQNALPAVSAVHAIDGRMHAFRAATFPQVVVDYSHTPDALQHALQTLREHCDGALWCVFGCGGDRDAGKRAQMARVAEQFSDRIVVTNDNPRTEDPYAICADIFKGFEQPDQIKQELDRAEAIKFAVQSAGQHDIVLVAGKGHEDYQIIGTKRFAFSDLAYVQELLAS